MNSNPQGNQKALGALSDNTDEFDVEFLRAHPFIKKTQILMRNEQLLKSHNERLHLDPPNIKSS